MCVVQAQWLRSIQSGIQSPSVLPGGPVIIALVASMNQTIYIIGTSHRYQHLSNEVGKDVHRNFQEMIKSIVSANEILMISEESNFEALEENGIPKSALQLVAEEIGVKQIFTEAKRSYRNTNGMEQESYIRAFGFIDGLNESEIEEKIQESYRARERYWLSQILSADVWPVLHVCGVNHAVKFLNLVTNEGMSGILLHEDWGN